MEISPTPTPYYDPETYLVEDGGGMGSIYESAPGPLEFEETTDPGSPPKDSPKSSSGPA